jgi:magnesium transporter
MQQTNGERPAPSDVVPLRIVVWRPTGKSVITDLADLPALIADPEARLWIDCIDPSPELVRTISTDLGLHPLIAEDITERNQRAKVETFDGTVHIVLFQLQYRGEVEPDEIDFVLGERFLLSVHGTECDLHAIAKARVGPEALVKRGADYLLYTLCDAIVDWTLQRLFVLKRELLAIRRATSPAREIFNQLTNRDISAIDEAHVLYFRDVYDHLIRVTDELDNYRELVAGTLDIYLSMVNNNLSRIMKRLTGVTVILAGIGAIAGVFGMSEAGAAFSGGEAAGFWLVTVAVVAAAVGAAAFLRRIDWI